MFVSSLETKIGLKSLPDEMRDLSSLQILEIRRCPELQRRCEKETGQDWDKIAHITEVYIVGEPMEWQYAPPEYF
uniref:Disease resistance protein n=1 Tax=Quercus lobata TaxID=97700 RepID=A0A7N2MGR5_QUELO